MARGRGKLTPQDYEYMKTISNNINKYLQRENYKQVDLVRATGIPASTLTGYVKGTSLPIPGNVQKIADFFGVLKSDIDPRFKSAASQNTGSDSVSKLSQELNKENHTKWVNYGNNLLDEQNGISEEYADYNPQKITELYRPEEEYEYLIVHGLESAGDGIWQEDDADIEVRIPKNEIPEQFDDLAMVIGDSMHPRLHNGDILFVAFTKQIEIGEIGVFRTSKGNFVKRLQADRLESLNPEYEDIYFSEDEYAEVVGVVVDVYRK